MPAPRTLFLATAVALAAAAPAAAQVPIVPTPAPAQPAPAAAAGKLQAAIDGSYKMDGKVMALKGDKLRIKGRLAPAIAGQRVQIRMNAGGKTLKTRKATVKGNGRFALPVRLKAKGKITISAVHKASGQIAKAQSKKTKLRVYEPSIGYGADGPVAALFNRELRQMKYAAPHSGTYDDATGRAVMAYRKVNGLPRTESATNDIVRDVIHGKGAYEVRYPELGKHVEADLSQQIVAFADGDKLVKVLHTSSGAPATPTVLGTYRFYSQTIGTNDKGMVHSSYFIRGYAIHGYPSVPTYNASHGCLRIPIPDAYWAFQWIDIGDQIRVTY